jgi:hypothetical protein
MMLCSSAERQRRSVSRLVYSPQEAGSRARHSFAVAAVGDNLAEARRHWWLMERKGWRPWQGPGVRMDWLSLASEWRVVLVGCYMQLAGPVALIWQWKAAVDEYWLGVLLSGSPA